MSKGWHSTRYDSLGNDFQAQIPVGAKVLTHLELWLAIHYTDTRSFGDFDFMKTDQKIDGFDYVVYSKQFSKGISPTTRQSDDYFNSTARLSWFNEHYLPQLENKAILQATIPTKGYGDIEIWRVKKDK